MTHQTEIYLEIIEHQRECIKILREVIGELNQAVERLRAEVAKP